MPRNKEFDEHEALEKAMNLFWFKGYHHTSIDDIVNATGVNRGGLYSNYGNKKSLFMKSLDRYMDTIVNDMLKELATKDAGLDAILRYFSDIREIIISGNASNGCLICNAYVEVGLHDQDVSVKIANFTNKKRDIYKNALKNAQNNQEISQNIDVDAMADHLTNTMMGIAVLCKSPSTPAMIDNIINMAVSSLKS